MKRNFNEIKAYLSKDGVVALPTETVFGLAVDATSDIAVARLYALKQRPLNKPIQIMVADREMAKRYVEFSDVSSLLSAHFWPGAVSLVMQRKLSLPTELTLSKAINILDDSLSVRVPDDTETCAMIRHYGRALAVSSANISELPPCQTQSEIVAQFGDSVMPIGVEESGCGVASTVLDVRDGHAIHLLREGPISMAEIERVLATGEC